MVFDDIPRVDATPSGHNEGRFAFLNRSASVYFGLVRSLIEEWFTHIPAADQKDLRGALRANNRQSESAFWELYLHEAYRRSGYDIEIHPEVSGSTTRPDFRVTSGPDSWYLEAVSVGRPPEAIAQDQRLNDVYSILTALQVVNFRIEVSTYSIGPNAPATKRLLSELRSWLGGLDPDVVGAAAEESTEVGFDRLPELAWEDAGWSLVFHALPLSEGARDRPGPALVAMGPGEAVIVDNVSGIRRVLKEKHGKYGRLESPLIVAVQSNTLYPTKDYEVEQALYGLAVRRPLESAKHPSDIFQDGFWLSSGGWRNGDTPQVITVHGLSPWTVTRTQPRCWQTLEPNTITPKQPGWLAPMLVGAESLPGPASPLATHFGLDADWPGMEDPDFAVV